MNAQQISVAQAAAESLRLIKEAQGNPNDVLAKAYVQSGTATSGITAYDLEAGAKLLFPVITPLRNMIPRVGAEGGIQANWRAVTAVNTAKLSLGLSEGNRGGVSTDQVTDYTAVYKELGLEQSETFKAELAAQGFDDLRALAANNLLKSVMIGEELIDLGGNTSLALGTTPTTALSQANTGGSLLDATAYGVGCVALTLDGYRRAAVAGGIVQTYLRTNADGSSDTINGGTAAPSAQANITTATASANTHVINATVTAVPGAIAYAWFWGLAAANLTLGSITTINSVQITADATGTTSSPGQSNFNALVAADYSRDSLVYDGLLTMTANSSLNSYLYQMPTGNAGVGTPLTADGAGGIVELEVALQHFWDAYRLSPDTMWVSSQEAKNISAKILAGTSNSAQRFVFTVDQAKVGGGVMVRSYLNKFSMNGPTEIPIRIHPNLPAGTIIFTTNELPYPMSNVRNVLQKKLRRDYYQIEWPLRSRKYEHGVYFDGVLQNYFPPAFGQISNIANG